MPVCSHKKPVMSITMDDYGCKLVNKILFAASQEEVKRYARAAMKGMESHKVNGHLVARFVDKMILQLREFSPMNYDAQQWTNIKMALILFNQIKRSLSTGASPVNL